MLIDLDSSCSRLNFSSYSSYSAGNRPWIMSVADLNNDNKNDIVVVNRDNKTRSFISVEEEKRKKAAYKKKEIESILARIKPVSNL